MNETKQHPVPGRANEPYGWMHESGDTVSALAAAPAMPSGLDGTDAATPSRKEEKRREKTLGKIRALQSKRRTVTVLLVFANLLGAWLTYWAAFVVQRPGTALATLLAVSFETFSGWRMLAEDRRRENKLNRRLNGAAEAD